MSALYGATDVDLENHLSGAGNLGCHSPDVLFRSVVSGKWLGHHGDGGCVACERSEQRVGLGSDDCGRDVDRLDHRRGCHAAELGRIGRDPCDVLHWGKLRLAALSVSKVGTCPLEQQ